MTTDQIGGVSFDAPLFRKASLEDLLFITAKLSSASYHYADDSAREWDTARECKDLAARKANELNLCFRAVECLVRHSPQLVTLGDFIDAMLKDLRK